MPITAGTNVALTINAQAAMQALKKPINETFAANTTKTANAAQEGAIHAMIVDSDGDGKVSAAEKNAHANDLLAHKDQIDRDGDGKISFQEELRWGLDQGDVTRAEVTRFLDTDTNKDGVLSAPEKVAYSMRQVTKKMKEMKA